MKNFGQSGVPAKYHDPDVCGTKRVSSSWNPIQLLRSPNWITLAAAVIVVLLILLVVFILRKVGRRRRDRRYQGGYRG